MISSLKANRAKEKMLAGFRVGCCLFLFGAWSLLFANDLIKVREWQLAKDEIKRVLVKYASTERLFMIRWTLYKNEGLVLFSAYDQIVSQHILYANHSNQSLRVELIPRGARTAIVPYLLVKFEAFDFAKHKAKLSLWLYDKNQEVFLKYLR